MKTIDVEVLKPHTYAGLRYQKGDIYACLPKFAKVLSIVGKVKLAEPKVEEVVPVEEKPKRTYRRRTPKTEENPEEKTDRTYIRRDMQAE